MTKILKSENSQKQAMNMSVMEAAALYAIKGIEHRVNDGKCTSIYNPYFSDKTVVFN